MADKNFHIEAVNELAARGAITGEQANQLRQALVSEPEQKTGIGDMLMDVAKSPVGPLGIAMSPMHTVAGIVDLIGKLRQGGVKAIEPDVLSGQMPMTGAIAGGAVGGVPGAAIGAGLGMTGQKIARVAGGLEPIPTQPKTLGESFRQNIQSQVAFGKEMLPEVAKQAALAGGGELVGRGIAYTAGKAAQYLPTIRARVQGAVESIPGIGGWVKGGRQQVQAEAKAAFKKAEIDRRAAFDAAEQARKAAYQAERESSVAGVRGLSTKTPVDAAATLQEAVGKAETALDQSLGKATSIIQQYGDRAVTVEPVRKRIMGILEESGMVSAKGNIVDDPLQGLLSSDQKAAHKYLTGLSEIIQKNPTLGTLDRIRRLAQGAANFGGANRTAGEKMIGQVAHEVRMALLDGLDEVATGIGDKAARSTVAAIRQNYAETKPVMDELGKIVGQYPEQIAQRAGSQMPGTFISDAAKRLPQLRQPIADVVTNDLIRSAGNPQAFTKAIDKYGRDSLQKVLDPKTFKAVLDYEKRMAAAWKPFQPGKFTAQQMSQAPLGKYWQRMYDAAKRGEKVSPENARLLFQVLGNSLRLQPQQQETPGGE